MSGDALHAMLHRRTEEAGMNPSAYGFHGLRAGHVTQTRRNGASTEEIMHHRRLARDYETHPHRSEAMIKVAMVDLISRRLTRESTPNWRDA